MISLRRAVERHRVRRPEPDAWLTFYPPTRLDPLADCFGNLISLKELWLPPGATTSRTQPEDGELLTYVREGNLTHEDSNGHSSVVQAGEFHLLTVNGGTSRDLNTSTLDAVHVYQLCLRSATPQAATQPAQQQQQQQQQRFSAAQRRGQFCLIASTDARRGSLRIAHDASVYAALLEPGQHVVHEMLPSHRVWLHLIHGAVSVGDLMLNTGDGVGISEQRGVAVTTREDSEILLVDFLEADQDATTQHHDS